jgi:hypothetical protein
MTAFSLAIYSAGLTDLAAIFVCRHLPRIERAQVGR